MNKIAIISNSAFSLVNFRSNLISDLIDNRNKVYALAPDFTQKEEKQIHKLGAQPVDIQMERTGMNPAKDFYSILNLRSVLRQLQADVTFSYGIKPVIYGLTASKFAGIPRRYAMVAGLGLLYADEKETSLKRQTLKSIANLLYKLSIRHADKVFFQNPDDIKLFEKKNIIRSGKSVLLNGSGVDLGHYESGHFQKDPITFTLVSRLIKEKGIYEFVEATKIIRDKFPSGNLRFFLIGDLDLNPNSISQEDLNTWVEDGIVTWPGHVDNVKEWLEETSVFVLPTYYGEGTPKSILEAMSMSRPVITTDMPGCREAVQDGKNGFLISPRNSSVLADTMIKFINNPALITEMGKKNRVIAESKYDVKKVNKKILEEMGL